MTIAFLFLGSLLVLFVCAAIKPKNAVYMDAFNAGDTEYGRHFKVSFKRKEPCVVLPMIDPVVITRSFSKLVLFIPVVFFLPGCLR